MTLALAVFFCASGCFAAPDSSAAAFNLARGDFQQGAAAFKDSIVAKRFYLAPDDHTDYLWTMDEEGYRKAFLEMLDYYLDQIDATANNPLAFQARWNCDGSFWLWTYERNKSAAEFDRLMARV